MERFDSYSFVMLAFMENELTVEDLEKEKEHIDYYASSPIVYWVTNKTLYESEDFKGLS